MKEVLHVLALKEKKTKKTSDSGQCGLDPHLQADGTLHLPCAVK